MPAAHNVKLVALAALGFCGCMAELGGPPAPSQTGSGGTVAVGGASTLAGGASSVGGASSAGTPGVAGSGGTLAGAGGLPPGAGGTVAAGTGGNLSAGSGGTESAGSGGDTANGGSAGTGTGGSDNGGAGNGGSSTGGSGTGGSGTGGSGTGGSGNGGSAGSAGTNSGGSGGTPTCSPNCGSHKWACWPMPNPASTSLPNPSSYTDMGTVVHDNVTCLDWEKTPPSTTRTNQGALDYCSGLSLGGYDDWRLPTRVEMASILDWTRSPATDAVFSAASAFHKTGSNWVLTIDQIGAGAGTDFAWAYNMSDGIVSNAYSAANPARGRCVRGGGSGEGFNAKAVPPPNLYTALSSDEVRDNYTGLIWQRDGDASGQLSWDAAVTYCNNLTLGGNDNWRLPSIRELATLVDEADVAPSIDEAMFPNTNYGSRSNNWYWASHRARNSNTASWGLNFDDGFTGFNAGAQGAWNYWTAAYAKCVR